MLTDVFVATAPAGIGDAGRVRMAAPFSWARLAVAVPSAAARRQTVGHTTVLNDPIGTTLGNHSPGRPAS